MLKSRIYYLRGTQCPGSPSFTAYGAGVKKYESANWPTHGRRQGCTQGEGPGAGPPLGTYPALDFQGFFGEMASFASS